MAIIYQHTNDKVLVLEPREVFQRKLDLGVWNEVRIGMYWGSGANATLTSSFVGETLVQATRMDILEIGLKDSATSIMPGYSGSYFIGLAMTGSVNTEVQQTFGTDSKYAVTTGNNNYWGMGFYGTSSYGGAQNLVAPEFVIPTSANYSGFYGLRIVLNNRGTSSQTVSVYASMTKSITASSTNYYSSYYLHQQMQNATYGTVSTNVWNDGGAALPIPDSLWIRIPYYFNRPRISNLSVIKYD